MKLNWKRMNISNWFQLETNTYTYAYVRINVCNGLFKWKSETWCRTISDILDSRQTDKRKYVFIMDIVVVNTFVRSITFRKIQWEFFSVSHPKFRFATDLKMFLTKSNLQWQCHMGIFRTLPLFIALFFHSFISFKCSSSNGNLEYWLVYQINGFISANKYNRKTTTKQWINNRQ